MRLWGLYSDIADGEREINSTKNAAEVALIIAVESGQMNARKSILVPAYRRMGRFGFKLIKDIPRILVFAAMEEQIISRSNKISEHEAIVLSSAIDTIYHDGMIDDDQNQMLKQKLDERRIK